MPMSTTGPQTQSVPTPSARIVPKVRYPLIWLIPVAALGVLIWLGWSAWSSRGVSIEIAFTEGYGLEPGDAVRYRGINVGVVEELLLDGDGISVHARIQPWARQLLHEGAIFWVVRPEVSLHRIAGLETLVGARYVAVASAGIEGAHPTAKFVGRETPPFDLTFGPGARRLVLSTDRRGGLSVGAPVMYRQTEIGVVTGLALSLDATHVEVHVTIDSNYVSLVRDNSRFWNAGGFDLNLGLKGFSARVDSFETFVAGGVALATPDQPGAEVSDGCRFDLMDAPEKEWLEWRPAIPLESK